MGSQQKALMRFGMDGRRRMRPTMVLIEVENEQELGSWNNINGSQMTKGILELL
jgi:hypothetical protein